MPTEAENICYGGTHEKSIKIIGIVLCGAILAAAVVGVGSRIVRAEDGSRIRKAFNAYTEHVQQLRAGNEFAAFDDPALSDWFAAPEGFLPVKDGNTYKSVVNPYDTPEKWDLLEDAEEMREVSQLPETARNAATAELVLYCMNYNLFDDMFVYDSMLEGFDIVEQDYDGIRLLAEREDAGAVLLNLYKPYKLDDQSQRDRNASLRLDYLETMLAQPEMLAKLTDEQCRELAAECYNKATQIMNARNDEYGITQTLYLGVKSLMQADPEFARLVNASDGAKTFAETGVLVPDMISNAELGAMAARVRLVINSESN